MDNKKSHFDYNNVTQPKLHVAILLHQCQTANLYCQMKILHFDTNHSDLLLFDIFVSQKKKKKVSETCTHSYLDLLHSSMWLAHFELLFIFEENIKNFAEGNKKVGQNCNRKKKNNNNLKKKKKKNRTKKFTEEHCFFFVN